MDKELMQALVDLVDWANQLGGWEAPCWRNALDLLGRRRLLADFYAQVEVERYPGGASLVVPGKLMTVINREDVTPAEFEAQLVKARWDYAHMLYCAGAVETPHSSFGLGARGRSLIGRSSRSWAEVEG